MSGMSNESTFPTQNCFVKLMRVSIYKKTNSRALKLQYFTLTKRNKQDQGTYFVNGFRWKKS